MVGSTRCKRFVVWTIFSKDLIAKPSYVINLCNAYTIICLSQSQGIDIADSELLDFISESSTMSKSLVDYGEQKSCAVTTAKRLAEFLGDSMVKDKGLHCQYIVAREPQVSFEVFQ